MPADIDVLVAGSSPISFPGRYLNPGDYDATPDLLTSEASTSGFRSGLSFPAALGTSPAIGHGSSTFGSSPPTHFTFHGRCSSPTLRTVPSSPPPSISLADNFNQLRLISSERRQMPVAVPRRPCLVVRCDVLDLPSANKNKKRVVFADDRGFPLALVRTMTEPSNMPPQWSLQFLSQLTRRQLPESQPEPWEATFSQPASDYLDFRRRLDTKNVSLENVIVKENEQSVVGTIKVRNLAFHKEVFVRTSSDDWSTQEDAFCTYVPNSSPAHGVTVLYDTFSFRLTLPPKSRKLEFCVCFRCCGVEYWDNNSEKNYFIVKKEAQTGPKRSPSLQTDRQILYSCDRKISLSPRFSDEAKPNAQFDSWSEFASWNHLNNDAPYW